MEKTRALAQGFSSPLPFNSWDFRIGYLFAACEGQPLSMFSRSVRKGEPAGLRKQSLRSQLI